LRQQIFPNAIALDSKLGAIAFFDIREQENQTPIMGEREIGSSACLEFESFLTLPEPEVYPCHPPNNR
jgi:hypothetical protein